MKLLTALIVTTYLFSTTELYQLLKLPALVAHYFEHKEKTPSMSVVDFLIFHYKGNHLENHPYDEDYEHDQKLPFMMHSNVLQVVCISPQPVTLESDVRGRTNDSRKTPIRNDRFINDSFLSAVWQPPRAC